MKTKLLIILVSICGLSFSKMHPVTEPLSAKRELVRQIYTAEIGVREKSGNNDGNRVEEYLAAAYLKKGNPWCAAFVCWVYNRAKVDHPHTGWAADFFPAKRVIWERNRKVYIHNSIPGNSSVLPCSGDLFGIWFPEKQRIAHIGFVDIWKDSWVITVEGNTNESGNRDGDGVYRKRRLVNSIYKVSMYVQ